MSWWWIPRICEGAATRLSVCRDHDKDIEYQFYYDAAGKLDRLRLINLRHIDPQANSGLWGNPPAEGDAGGKPRSRSAGFMDWLCEDMARNSRKSPRSLFDESYAPREFICCTDQVGTLRAITTLTGGIIKETRRDSFGIPYYDSFPGFVPPIGFAGGLTDPDTGLVRFGWRDYDPMIGRFTALDPARDRRGDGDLYDYCMDDPVSRVDPVTPRPPAPGFSGPGRECSCRDFSPAYAESIPRKPPRSRNKKPSPQPERYPFP